MRWRLHTSNGEDIGVLETEQRDWAIGDALTDENDNRFQVLDVTGFESVRDNLGLREEFMPAFEFAAALIVTPLELA